MHVSRAGWPRVVLLVLLVGTQVAWLGQAPASAHSPISTIVLEVTGSRGDIAITATIRYPDSDPVESETVAAVAYSPDLRQVRPLKLTEIQGQPGRWLGTVHLTPAHWQVEVDAIRKTRGLQSIGFEVADDGTLAEVSSPSPLPATVVVPGATAEAGTGRRVAPASGAARSPVTWAVMLGMAGLLALVVLRRRAPTEAR